MPGPDPPPATPLSSYLAANDLSCAACGYNLRGVTQPFCPECGMVVPRPASDKLAESQERVPRRLWCRKCGYNLSAHRCDVCPECGETALIKLVSEEEGAARFIRWLLRTTAVVAALALAFGLAGAFGASRASWVRARDPGFAIAGALLLVGAIVNASLARPEFSLQGPARRIQMIGWARAALGIGLVSSGILLLLLAA